MAEKTRTSGVESRRGRTRRERSGIYAAPTYSLDLGMRLKIARAQEPDQAHATDGGNDCGQKANSEIHLVLLLSVKVGEEAQNDHGATL